MSSTVQIAHRFRGPHTSGNGGYCCGVLARHLSGPVEATLEAPPPLDTDLTLEVEGDQAKLMLGERRIGRARVAGLDLEVPAAPTVEQARAATAGYAGHRFHPLPECFVCGTRREAGDALCIHAGPVDGRDLVAAPWRPDASLADEDGLVANEHLWAALDCPSYFGLQRERLFALLGRMTASIDRKVRPGDPLTVIGWSLGSEGRKHHAGSAIFDDAGHVVGRARALWIEVDPSRMP